MQTNEFSVKPSKIFLGIAIIIIAIHYCLALFLPFNFIIKLLLLFLLCLYTKALIKNIRLRHPKSIRQFHYANQQWLIENELGRFKAKLQADSIRNSIVSILRFKLDARNEVVTTILFRDSLLNDNYQALQFILNFRD